MPQASVVQSVGLTLGGLSGSNSIFHASLVVVVLLGLDVGTGLVALSLHLLCSDLGSGDGLAFGWRFGGGSWGIGGGSDCAGNSSGSGGVSALLLGLQDRVETGLAEVPS